MMKKNTLLILMLLAFDFGFGQTTLAPGDIAITGFNTDNPDEFSFVLLRDVVSGTEINFTDKGWDNLGYFRTSGQEGVITWTTPSYLECGTEVVIADIGVASGGSAGGPFSSTIGTASETDLGFAFAGGTDLSDQLIVYQGTLLVPTLLYAVQFRGITGWTNATDTYTSGVPTGLTDGVNAVYYTGDNDNGSYNCTTTSGSTLILSDVIDSSNWYLTNSTTVTNRPVLGACSYTCSSCTTIATWNGLWVAGITPDTTTIVELNTDYDTGINGSFSACSLNVNSGTLTIADNTYVEVQNDLTAAGNILVQPQGAFVQNDDLGTVTATGTINVVKTTASANNWYEYTYWSSPVSGETIEVGLTDSEISKRYVFYGQNFLDATSETANDGATVGGQDDVDDNGDDWQPASGIMIPGVGYASAHDKFIFNSSPGNQFDYTFSGAFNNGIITVPIYRNDSELNDNNWNLIGNPYPSAIDADLFLAANSYVADDIDGIDNSGASYTDGAIFIWSHNTAPSSTVNGNEDLNFSDSDYAIINGTGQSAGGDGVVPNRFIPSGQAFFISMDNGATASLVSGDVYTADVTFNNSMRVLGTTDNSQFFKNSNTKKSSTSVANKLWVDLTSDNGVFNQTMIGYVDGASNDDDGSYFDAQKNIYNVTSAILYTIIDNSDKKFAIQGKDINSLNEDEIINLGFSTNIDVATLYKLSITDLEGDFLNGNTVYIKDNLLNKLHNLSAGDYTFTSEVGEFNERFEIVFNANALSADEVVLNTNKFSIVDLNSDRVQFNTNSNLNIKTIRVFDLLGRQLYDLKGHINSEIYTLSNLNNAVYIAKIELSNGMVITKKAVKK
ncbi:MAG: T9SS type A sorting domain-containing protein [Algibacter sp.]